MIFVQEIILSDLVLLESPVISFKTYQHPTGVELMNCLLHETHSEGFAIHFARHIQSSAPFKVKREGTAYCVPVVLAALTTNPYQERIP
jgi:hypothetical protein